MPGTVLGTLGGFAQSPVWSDEMIGFAVQGHSGSEGQGKPQRLVFLPSEPTLLSAASLFLTTSPLWVTLSKLLYSLGLSFPTCKLLE